VDTLALETVAMHPRLHTPLPAARRAPRRTATICRALAPLALALCLPAAWAQGSAELDKRLDDALSLRKAGQTTQARAILDELVAQGHAKAMSELAEALRTGTGAEKDPARALPLFEKAADAGNLWSVRMVGWMYEKGEGVPADAAKALAAYTRAADKGDTWSAAQIGDMYLSGSTATPASPAEAMRWWQRAAKGGSAFAMNALGRHYVTGLQGVPKNPDEAHFWSVRAMVAGNENAKQRLLESGYRSPVDVMGAFNRIVQNSGGRLRVANYQDQGINGGTFTLYRTADGSAGGNVVWMMDFGVKPSPELRTVIAAKVRKANQSFEKEGHAWRETILRELKLPTYQVDPQVFESDLRP
jgi:TPR repeat protein